MFKMRLKFILNVVLFKKIQSKSTECVSLYELRVLSIAFRKIKYYKVYKSSIFVKPILTELIFKLIRI